jgi:cysteinyl-tRNA synthetase
MIKLHNTLTRKVEEFSPLSSDKVTIYTCGPTVYDYQHIGNYSGYIYWDILVRILRIDGYKVDRVMNITDVGHLVSDADEGEDKLEKGAKREGKTAWEIAEFYTKDFIDSVHKLNLVPANHYAKATEHIPEQIDLIKKLEEKGYTYKITDGVYFNTSKFPKYADFAMLDLADQKEGARVQVNPEKINPSDFALWKFTPTGQKRDMEWDSPWGKGFPGWHIECSAMAMEYLGESIDIHTGGIDHIPVHHTNEIAQSEAATGKKFVNYWLHNNFLKVDETKISKSLENGITLHQLEDRGFSVMDFKMFVLQSHYRTESNFTWENLQAAKNRLASLYAFSDLRWQTIKKEDDVKLDNFKERIVAAIRDDLNTPQALSILSEVIDITTNTYEQGELTSFVEFLDSLFGFELLSRTDISTEQKALINQRENARTNNDYEKADELRAKLKQQGIELNDTSSGPIWTKV